MEPEFVIERDYRYHAAGRIWLVPKLHLIRLPDNSLGLPQTEIDRVQRAIANELCGAETPMTGEEFEFLCDVVAVPYALVAEALQLDPSTLSRWRDSGRPMADVRSLVLERWFWFRMFGDRLSAQTVPLGAVENDIEFLHFVRDAAIQDNLEDQVHKAVA